MKRIEPILTWHRDQAISQEARNPHIFVVGWPELRFSALEFIGRCDTNVFAIVVDAEGRFKLVQACLARRDNVLRRQVRGFHQDHLH